MNSSALAFRNQSRPRYPLSVYQLGSRLFSAKSLMMFLNRIAAKESIDR
jgi:hypothetical protein